MNQTDDENKVVRRAYPLRTVRAAMCLYAAGGESGLHDNDIEKMLGIETEGIVRVWRDRGRGGNWEAKRAWVENEADDEEEDRPFELSDRRELLKSSVEVARMLLMKCKDALEGKKNVEFVSGEKPTARNVIEGLQRAHVIIEKDTTQLREIEESVRDERQVEEERVRRILRRVQQALAESELKLTPEQLEVLRKAFPGVPLLWISEVLPQGMAAEV